MLNRADPRAEKNHTGSLPHRSANGVQNNGPSPSVINWILLVETRSNVDLCYFDLPDKSLGKRLYLCRHDRVLQVCLQLERCRPH